MTLVGLSSFSGIAGSVKQFLSRSMTFREFENAIIEQSKGITGGGTVEEFADAINGLVMECAGGHINEDQLRSRLSEILEANAGAYVTWSYGVSSTTFSTEVVDFASGIPAQTLFSAA